MKKLSTKLLGLGLFSLAVTTQAQAQEKVTISGEIRPRSEFRNGFKKPILNGVDPAFFTEQRTRLNFKYSDDKMEVVLSLQDVRNWGAVAQIYKTDPSLNNIYEGYAKYKFNPKAGLAVGRIALDYDNARFLGNLAWASQARSHDLGLFTYNDSSFNLHIGAAFNQDANTPEYAKLTSTFYSGVANYKTMQFLWLHKDAGQYGLSFLVLNNGVQWGTADSSGVRYSQTFGFYGEKKKGPLKATLEAYAQTGKNAADTDISAYFIGASATLTKIEKLPLTLGFDYLSGTEAGSSKDGAFNPMYGTNHKFYGFMDYFYVGNGHSNAGLLDIYFKTAIKLGEKSKLLVHVHNFGTAVDIADPTDATKTLSSQLGQEVDLVFVQNISKTINLNIGYSQLFKTETMDAVKGLYGANTSDTNVWAWAMLTFKPTFFSK